MTHTLAARHPGTQPATPHRRARTHSPFQLPVPAPTHPGATLLQDLSCQGGRAMGGADLWITRDRPRLWITG